MRESSGDSLGSNGSDSLSGAEGDKLQGAAAGGGTKVCSIRGHLAFLIRPSSILSLDTAHHFWRWLVQGRRTPAGSSPWPGYSQGKVRRSAGLGH